MSRLFELDAEIGEEVASHRLDARAGQHELDTSHPDGDTIAHADLRGSKGLVGAPHELHDPCLDVERVSRHRAGLAADPQRQVRSLARFEAEAHRHRVPHRAESGLFDAALQQSRKEEGRVPRRAAAGIVRYVGDDDRAAIARERAVERFGDREIGRHRAPAKALELRADLLRDTSADLRRAVRDDEDTGADVRHIAPGKAVRDRDGENTVLALPRLHAVDEPAHRLPRRVVDPDHPAVVERHHGLDLALRGRRAEVHEFLRPLDEIGVGVLLVADQDIGMVDHPPRHVAVRIELAPDDGFRADERAHTGQKIALAVVVAVRHHGAVHAQQHDVDRQGLPEVVEQFVSKRLVRVPGRDPGRLREGAKSFDDLPVVGLGPLSRDPERSREQGRLVGMLPGAIGVIGEALEARGDGRERVGLGRERSGENSHAISLPVASAGKTLMRSLFRWRRPVREPSSARRSAPKGG
jgi:hypothetical protein